MVVKKKTTKKTVAAKKTATKKTTTKKPAVTKKTAAKKTPAKKSVAAPKKVVTKKTATKKTVVKKATVAAPEKPKVATVKMSKNTTPATASSISLHGASPYKEKRGEVYMNPSQAAHFRTILSNWKLELMEEVDRTVHHMQDDAANFPDPNDRASQESEFALELRTRDRERKLIKKIDESLENLKNNDYGYCDVCGIEIGIRRLEARPTATQCIDCKTLDEIREKQSRV
jgi:DnaK suppressor protein